jgi:hypothetical protein
VQKISVKFLAFDGSNPRFSGGKVKGDIEVIRYLAETADLGELLQSIAASGYIDIEPLIVMRVDDIYLVLEGNRRLAALRLLADPDLAKKCEIVIPDMGSTLRNTLNSVSVYPVKNRDEARNFIGFKHINGPHRWDSLAKARFAADWFRKEKKKGTTLKEIARHMGDRHDTIKRMVAGIYVLDQARDAHLFDIEDRFPGRAFGFSHLYTALTRPGFRAFLGLSEDWRTVDPEPDPVPENHLDDLKRLMVWLYGSKEDEVRPVVSSQNPHVAQLAEVLAKPKARTLMLNTNDLAAAYAEVDTPALQFEKSLVEAHQHTENAVKKVTAYEGGDETLVQVATELSANASLIVDVISDKRKKVPQKRAQ